jgi:hypothetical protein
MKTVILKVTANIEAILEEGEEIEDIINNMDYSFSYFPDRSASERITNTEILSYEEVEQFENK